MNVLRKALAEMIGTFAIVFVGCGSVMVAERFPDSISLSAIPVIFGLTVAAMVYAVGHISGAHFNPAVTAAFAVARHFPGKQVLIYWASQVLGSFIAIWLLSVLLPHGDSFGATVPVISPLKAVILETVITFFLMFAIIAVATDTRAIGTMAGVAIGAAVMIGAFIGGPLTGASMNPARSLAPAVFENRLDVYWIYLIGPMVGAILAALIYEQIRCEKPRDKAAKGCC